MTDEEELMGIITIVPTYREPTQVEKWGRLRDIVATEIVPGLIGLYIGGKIIQRVFRKKSNTDLKTNADKNSKTEIDKYIDEYNK